MEKIKTGSITLNLSNELIKKGDWYLGTLDGVRGIYQANSDKDGKAAWLFDALKINSDPFLINRLTLLDKSIKYSSETGWN